MRQHGRTTLRLLGLLALGVWLAGTIALAVPLLHAAPQPQGADVPAGDLSPRPAPYQFFFQNEAYLAPWEPDDGENWVFEEGYVQVSEDDAHHFSYYEGQIDGDYEFSVTLSYEAGAMGGGLLFNAPTKGTVNNAMLVAYDPRMPEGAVIQWGQFDQNGQFTLFGSHVTPLTADDGLPRTLTVRVRSDLYTISLEQPNGEQKVLLSETVLQADRVLQPFVGLYATQSRIVFSQATVAVSAFSTPTPTAAPTATPTPPSFETPPTETPTPTLTITPDPGDLLPPETPGGSTVFEFDFVESANDNWLVSRQGDWSFAIDGGGGDNDDGKGLVQNSADFDNAFTIYNFRLFGDYTMEVEFEYLGGDGGGGVIFNAPSRSLRDAYIAAFRVAEGPSRTNLLWGYFEENDDDDLELVRISQTSRPDDLQRPDGQKGPNRTLTIIVRGNSYTIRLEDPIAENSDETRIEPWVNNQPLPTGRVFQPYIGLYTHRGQTAFKNVRITVENYSDTPTPAPTPTGQPTATGTRPTRTPTPTPTWTPSSPTPTVTPTPGTPTVTPTVSPVLLLTPVTSTPTTPPVISQPGPEQQGVTLLDQTATAQAAADVASQGTATAQALFDAETAAALAAPPTATPDIGVATEDPFQPESPPSTPAGVAQAPAAVTPSEGASTPPGEEEAIIVTATPSATQRPIEASTPTPPPAASSLALFGRIWQTSARALFLLWFLVGSVIFFAAAGIVLGLSMRRPSEDELALFDAEEDGLPTLPPITGEPGGAPSEGQDDPSAPDDNWPASLP